MERLRLDIQKFATSGRLQTPANEDGSYFVLDWNRTSYSIADNTSTIYWTLWVHAAYNYYDNAVSSGPVVIDGETVYGGGTYSNVNKGDRGITAGHKTIQHNADGAKSFSASISGWTWGCSWVSANNSSNPFVLNTIPRYTTVSTWNVTSRTETSITLNWKTADTCSQIRYGTSTSSYTTANVNSNSGTVTISGLQAGQPYTLYFMPKRKDSSLWGDGSDGTWKSLTNQATYRYPYCSSTSKNFIIGQPVTISIYNPLKKDVKIQMWSHTSQDFVSDLIDVNTGNKDSYTGFDDVVTRLYQSIPNAKSSAYNIDVWTGSHKEVNTVGNYSVDETENKPSFNDFTYADINSTTTALTGDDQKVIQGYSNIQATISVANKATAQHYATMDHYDLIIQGNTTQSASYSDNEDVTIVVNNANSGSIKVNAVDSRNIPKEVPKTAELIPYTNIQRGNISVTRAGNVGEATTLAFNGTLWEGDFGAVTNTITSVQYRFKSTASGSEWSSYASLTPPTPSGNSYSFSGLIAGDEGNTGFSVDNSFNIEVVVSDRLSSITFTATLGTGIPHVAFGNNGIAIKQPYDDNDDSVLQVNGKTNIKGNLVCNSFHSKSWDFNTNNTTDTWVPVAGSNGKWQHRAIPTAYNSTTPALDGVNFRNKNSATIEWKENGYGDKFRIIPDFGGTDDSNKLKIQGTVGGAGTDPTNWVDLLTISGKNGILTAQNFNYSTNEIVIGKWIDGRLLYRKVYKITSGIILNNENQLDVSSLNINRMIRLEGFTYSSEFRHIDLNFYNSDHNHMFFGINDNKIRYWPHWNTSEVYIIIEYTKN